MRNGFWPATATRHKSCHLENALAGRPAREYPKRQRQGKVLSSPASSACHRQTGECTMNNDRCTYRVTWSPEDGEYIGQCAEFPSLSWLASTPEAALSGIRKVIAQMAAMGETAPAPFSERRYSGEFRVRIPPSVHRTLAIQAAEQRVSLNRLASAKLAG